MRKFPYDYDRIYETAYIDAKFRNKGMSEEWYKQKAKEIVPQLYMEIFKGNL